MTPGAGVMTPGKSRTGNEGDGGADPRIVSRAERAVVAPVSSAAGRDLKNLLLAGGTVRANVPGAESLRADGAASARVETGSCPRWILNLRTRKRWNRPLPSSRSRMMKKGNASRAGLPSVPSRSSMMST